MARRLAWTGSLALSLASLCLSLTPAAADDVNVAAADTTTVQPVPTAPTTEYVRSGSTQEEAENAWIEYFKNVGNRYMVGFNSLITFPADPVMDTVKPREEFNGLPGAKYGPKYVAGFGTGVMLSMYRAATGAYDVLWAPVTPMKVLSPEPRYMLLPATHPEF
ncbi:MAG TPA: hypothetical protein VFY49_02135 [Myxococcota bacterium]|nr:hypothetical protein [Myxococcota bacterium]